MADITIPFFSKFENPTFSDWTGQSGSPTIQDDIVHHHTYAAQIPCDSRIYGTFSDQDTVNVRVYVRWTTSPSSGNEAKLFNIGHTDASGTLVFARIINDSGTMKWGLRTLNDSSVFVNDIFAGGPTPEENTWYCVELKWKKNTANGAEMYVNGTSVGTTTATTADIQADTFNVSLQLTEITAYYDCAVVAVGYIGTESDLLVNNLTVKDVLTMQAADGQNYLQLQTIKTGTNPILQISQGILGTKDICCLGYLGAESFTELHFDNPENYVKCTRSDLGKMVLKNDNLVENTVLARYDNDYRIWWLSRANTIETGSVMTIQDGTGSGTTTQPSKATGGGAIMLGQGYEQEGEPPRINLVDSGDHILCITAGSTWSTDNPPVYLGVDDVLANMKLKDLTALGNVTVTQLVVPAQHDVFSVIAGDNGPDTDVYLVPQNPSNTTGLGLGTANIPFKWVDATNVFADNINGLKADQDLTISPNAGQKVVVDGDINVTGTISTDNQLKVGYDGSWTQIQFENDSNDSMIAKTVKASSPNWLWLDAYADNGYTATVGVFRHSVSGTPRFLILNGDDYASTPFEFLPRDGKITIFGDTNLYRSAVNTLKTDDDFICSNLTSDELDIKSPNNVFSVVAGDNGVNQDTYLIPQNPAIGAGLGLGTVAYPFKWVDATNVFANNINGLDNVDMTINPNVGRKVVINGDLQVTGSFSTGTQKGSNTTDANGDCTVNFAQAFGSAPLVFVQSRDSTGRGVRFDVTSKSTTSFTVKATVLPVTHKHKIGQALATVNWTMGIDNSTGAHQHGFNNLATVDLAHTHGTHQHGFGAGVEQAAVNLAHSHGSHSHSFSGSGSVYSASAGTPTGSIGSDGYHHHQIYNSTTVVTDSRGDTHNDYYAQSPAISNGLHSHSFSGSALPGHAHSVGVGGTIGSTTVSLGNTTSTVGGNTKFVDITLEETSAYVEGTTEQGAAHGHDLSNKAPYARSIQLRDDTGAVVEAGGTMTTVADSLRQLYTEAADLSAESKIVPFDWMAIPA